MSADLPPEAARLLEAFVPHVQQVAGAAIDWQVEKFLEVRARFLRAFPAEESELATRAALELVKSGLQVPAQNALPFGFPTGELPPKYPLKERPAP